MTSFVNPSGVFVSGGAGISGPTVPAGEFFADTLDDPNTADWAVNGFAPIAIDSVNSGLLSRTFLDTGEVGVGWSMYIPDNANTMIPIIISRASVGGVGSVGVKIYKRLITDVAAVGAWSSNIVAGETGPGLAFPTAFWEYDLLTPTAGLTMANWGITRGYTYQFELTRIDPFSGGDLVGNWNLLSLQIFFG